MASINNWKVPEWMKPYLKKVLDWDHAFIEDLYNDDHTTVFINAPRVIQIVSVKNVIDTLNRLHEENLLKSCNRIPDEQKWIKKDARFQLTKEVRISNRNFGKIGRRGTILSPHPIDDKVRVLLDGNRMAFNDCPIDSIEQI